MSTFDLTPIIRAQKPTADEQATIAAAVKETKRLFALLESARPSNSVETRKKVEAAHAAVVSNPSVGTIDTFLAIIGLSENPQRVFEQLDSLINSLVDAALEPLSAIGKRLHASALKAAQDPKQFGLPEIDKLPDLAARGEALTAFAAGHKQALADFESEAAPFETKRGGLHWLSKHAFAEAIIG